MIDQKDDVIGKLNMYVEHSYKHSYNQLSQETSELKKSKMEFLL